MKTNFHEKTFTKEKQQFQIYKKDSFSHLKEQTAI